jgi:hypothetical protein
MVDVRLLYPSDKYEAAVRLAEAVAAAGYEVECEALAASGAFPRLAAEADKAKVLLLIWSRELVAAAMASEALVEARRHSNLVEISVDGIEPVGGAEVSPVVLLCGWRGQPFHPGWQRILADIKRHSGSREPAARSRRAESPGGAGRTPPGADPRRPPARPAVRAAVAAGALAIATLGAATALDWSSPGAPTVADARPASAAAAAAPAAGAASRPVAAAPAPAPDPVEIAALAPPSPGLPAKPAPAAGPVAPRKPAAGDLGPRKAAATQRSSPKRLAAPSEPGVKRYSRKNSKTMRLFCKRSGRSTPQCRTFARSMRDSRG